VSYAIIGFGKIGHATVKDFLAAIGRGGLSHRLIGEKRS